MTQSAMTRYTIMYELDGKEHSVSAETGTIKSVLDDVVALDGRLMNILDRFSPECESVGWHLKESDLGFGSITGACYVPNSELVIYTKEAFVQLCDGDLQMANHIFGLCEGRRPADVLEEERSSQSKLDIINALAVKDDLRRPDGCLVAVYVVYDDAFSEKMVKVGVSRNEPLKGRTGESGEDLVDVMQIAAHYCGARFYYPGVGFTLMAMEDQPGFQFRRR